MREDIALAGAHVSGGVLQIHIRAADRPGNDQIGNGGQVHDLQKHHAVPSEGGDGQSQQLVGNQSPGSEEHDKGQAADERRVHQRQQHQNPGNPSAAEAQPVQSECGNHRKGHGDQRHTAGEGKAVAQQSQNSGKAVGVKQAIICGDSVIGYADDGQKAEIEQEDQQNAIRDAG